MTDKKLTNFCTTCRRFRHLPGCKWQVQMPQLHRCPLGACRIFGATRRGERHALGAAPHGFEEQTSWALAADDHTSSVAQQDLPGRPKSDEGDGAKRALTVTSRRKVQTLADFGQSWQDARQGSCAEVRRKRLSGSLSSSVSTLLPCLVHLVR